MSISSRFNALQEQRRGHGFETRWGHLMSYRYQSVARTLFKARWKLRDFVEDHHVIPRQFQNHKVLRELAFDVNASKNLVMMPTRLGLHVWETLRRDRLVHGGHHRAYNQYVKNMLDHIRTPEEFWDFHRFLKRNCRDNKDCIPW